VGAGTFQPVKVDRIADHVMHSERFSFTAETADEINAAKRLVAIGTTSARVLESLPPGPVTPQSGSTDIYIYPPYSFQRVQVLLTNFHLPKSTLLMLVSAMAGREHVLAAYQEAINESYRFYSYGDCMLLV
jgi:S-adenosylmethionine:tRNA ribosyltransferase-isomerase